MMFQYVLVGVGGVTLFLLESLMGGLVVVDCPDSGFMTKDIFEI